MSSSLITPVPSVTTGPDWSPGPGFVEVATGHLWARPKGDLFEVVAYHQHDVDEPPALLCGLVTGSLLMAEDGLCLHLDELESLTEVGTYGALVLGWEHPLVIWWSDQTEVVPCQVLDAAWQQLGIDRAAVQAGSGDRAERAGRFVDADREPPF